MATPPFNPNISVPGDSDFASQFPAAERTFRDQIKSWLLINHNDDGQHFQLDMPVQSSAPATPASGIYTIYFDDTGILRIIDNGGTVYNAGVPVGTVFWVARSTSNLPQGYISADGSAISRTTFSRLFNHIGTAFGSGDGTNTFNVPDLLGRVIAGPPLGTGRISSTFFTASGAVVPQFTAAGGSQSHTIIIGEMPAHSHGGGINGGNSFDALATVTSGNYAWVDSTRFERAVAGSSTNPLQHAVNEANSIFLSFSGSQFKINSDGGGNAMSILPPMLILNPVIRY